MGEDPEQLRRDIEATRRELTADVDALTEKVSPARVVERRVERTKSAVSNIKERVMGSASDKAAGISSSTGNGVGTLTSGVGDAASSAAASVSGAASSAVSTVASAPDRAKRRTEGNPLAAGVIAFGVGWLASSLLPSSEREQQAASKVTDLAKEHAEPVKAHLSGVASELKESLTEPAQQAVESVKSTAQDAAATVKEHAQSAGGDVADQAKTAASTLKSGSGSDDSPSSGAETTAVVAPIETESYQYDLGTNPATRESSTF